MEVTTAMRGQVCRALSVVLVLCFVVSSLAACETKTDVIRIGITQITTHPGLDAVREGFLAGMEELGYEEGVNVEYIYKNPLGQMNQAQLIAQEFVNADVDIMVPISTPSSLACAKASSTIPIVFGAITDPLGAGLVNSLEEPGKNVTGVSDVWPYEKQIDLLLKVVPTVKRIGMVFNPGETNSVYAMTIIRDIIDKKNLTLVEVSVSSTNEVRTAAQSLIGRVDALYIAADNTVVEAMESVVKVAQESKLPLLVGDTASVERGGLLTYGTNYFEVGKATAVLVDRIIKGEDPAKIPVAREIKADLYINLKTARDIGVTFPADLVSQAAKAIE